MLQHAGKGNVRVCLYLPEKLLEMIDSARGDVPRSKYITRQLEVQAVTA